MSDMTVTLSEKCVDFCDVAFCCDVATCDDVDPGNVDATTDDDATALEPFPVDGEDADATDENGGGEGEDPEASEPLGRRSLAAASPPFARGPLSLRTPGGLEADLVPNLPRLRALQSL